jgi:AcrR family transcriptional regulator
MPRAYRLGRRRGAVDRTAATILRAARELIAERGMGFSFATLARQAGVSRATIYNHFGSRTALLDALRPRLAVEAAGLCEYIEGSCAAWAADPSLFRSLPPADSGADAARRIAEGLAAADSLRPGCSLKEAEDVIGVLTSFSVFDRLHRDGRRSPAAVADVLSRLAGGILA